MRSPRPERSPGISHRDGKDAGHAVLGARLAEADGVQRQRAQRHGGHAEAGRRRSRCFVVKFIAVDKVEQKPFFLFSPSRAHPRQEQDPVRFPHPQPVGAGHEAAPPGGLRAGRGGAGVEGRALLPSKG